MTRIAETFRRMWAMALPAVAAIILGGCSEGDDENRSVVATLYDVAEVIEAGEETTVFEVYRPDAAEGAVLTADGSLFSESDEVGPGHCVFLAYQPDSGEPYTSGAISVLGWGKAHNEALLQSEPEHLADWDRDPVWLQSLWRAGDKVILRTMLTYDSEPRVFALVLDKTTLADEYPEAYLVHNRKTDRPNFKRQFYAAFDVGALWSYPSCRGLRIHVNNSNLLEANLFVVDNPRCGQK